MTDSNSESDRSSCTTTDPRFCRHEDAEEVVDYVLKCEECEQIIIELPDGFALSYDIEEYYEIFPREDPDFEASDTGADTGDTADMSITEAHEILGMDVPSWIQDADE